MPLANARRETVQFSYPVAADHSNLRSLPEAVLSRSFELWVSAPALARGVTLRTDAPGAVIRVSTHSANAALGLDTLAVTTSNGRVLTARAASDQLVNGDDLRAAGLGGDARTLGFRLASELGAGEFVVRGDASLPAQARVLISVLVAIAIPRCHSTRSLIKYWPEHPRPCVWPLREVPPKPRQPT